MTREQAMALKHHCRFAFETADLRFGFVAHRSPATVVLTVNSGYE